MTETVSRAGGVVWAADTLHNLATHAFFVGAWSSPGARKQPAVDNRGKHTVAFLFTDGDSLCADTVGLIDSTHWSSKRRGAYPMAWGVDPSLAFLAPGTLGFLYNTSTANDAVVGFAPGYAYPSYMTEEQRWLYAEEAGETMAKAGLTINYVRRASASASAAAPIRPGSDTDGRIGRTAFPRLLQMIDFNFSAEFFGPLLHQWSVDGSAHRCALSTSPADCGTSARSVH